MARENYREIAAEAYRAVGTLNQLVHKSSIEPGLIDLVYLRVSQLNGCAYCVDSHTYEALAKGEAPQRLYDLTVWRETSFFTPRERAALAWTDVVTRLGEHGVPDEAFRAVREEFDVDELVPLTLAIVAINGWNRIAIAFHADVGSYQPRAVAHA